METSRWCWHPSETHLSSTPAVPAASLSIGLTISRLAGGRMVCRLIGWSVEQLGRHRVIIQYKNMLLPYVLHMIFSHIQHFEARHPGPGQNGAVEHQSCIGIPPPPSLMQGHMTWCDSWMEIPTSPYASARAWIKNNVGVYHILHWEQHMYLQNEFEITYFCKSGMDVVI